MCRVAHCVLKHRLRQTRVAAFITERTGILHSQRSVRSLCGRRLRGGPSSPEVARLGWLFWGELRPMLDVDSREHLTHEVRRIILPRTWVNRLPEPLLTRYLDSGSYEASGAYEGKTRGRIVR